MSSVLDYITTNNLPLITWLNASPENIVVSGNSFTWKNSNNNTSFDFIQNIFSKHPIVSTDGVSFTSSNSISSRNPNLIDGKSYSIIGISKNSFGIDQVLVQLKQLVNTSVNVITYKQLAGKLLQEYRRTYLNTLLTFSNTIAETVNIVCINHFVKLGRTTGRVDNSPHELRETLQNAYKLETGGAVIGDATIVNLYHFLVFSPAISETQLDDIVDLLIASTPSLNPNPFWDLLITDTWDTITEAIWNNIL
jgi:hypothetical protein